MKCIAHIRTSFTEKFGIPRQSGVVKELIGRIVFEPEYRNRDALRGMEDFTYLWLIWEFSEAKRDSWSPTVRPPRLGGNERMGVFATRSPFRPNPIGLSSVKLEGIEYDSEEGPCIIVSGIDMMDNTPIFDIKPYIPYADSHPQARGGFTDATVFHHLKVVIPPELEEKLSRDTLAELRGALAEDPRPAYQRDAKRVYTFTFAGKEVSFKVEQDTLLVLNIE